MGGGKTDNVTACDKDKNLFSGARKGAGLCVQTSAPSQRTKEVAKLEERIQALCEV